MIFEQITERFNISGVIQQINGNLKYTKTAEVRYAIVLEHSEHYDLDRIMEWLEGNEEQIKALLADPSRGKISDDFGRIRIIPVTSADNQYQVDEYSGYISIFAVEYDSDYEQVTVYLLGTNEKLLSSNTVLITLNVSIEVTGQIDEKIKKSGLLGLKKTKSINSYVKVKVNARKLMPNSLWYEISSNGETMRFPITNEIIENPFYIKDVKRENVSFYSGAGVTISYVNEN